MRTLCLAVVAAAALAGQADAGQRARAVPRAAGPREPSEAEMKAAVLKVVSFRVQRVGMQMTITYFEKQGCEKAQGRIGYNCDFLVRYGGNGMVDLANAFIGTDAATQASGRFYLRSGEWDFIEDRRESN